MSYKYTQSAAARLSAFRDFAMLHIDGDHRHGFSNHSLEVRPFRSLLMSLFQFSTSNPVYEPWQNLPQVMPILGSSSV